MDLRLSPLYGIKITPAKEVAMKVEASVPPPPSEVKAIVPLIILNRKLPEFMHEVQNGYAIRHPMFPGLHCKLVGFRVMVRLANFSIAQLYVKDFVMDDGT